MLQSEVYYFFLTLIVKYHYESPFSGGKKVSTRTLAQSAIDVFSSSSVASKSRIALHYYRDNVTDILTGKNTFLSLFLALVLLHCLNDEAECV